MPVYIILDFTVFQSRIYRRFYAIPYITIKYFIPAKPVIVFFQTRPGRDNPGDNISYIYQVDIQAFEIYLWMPG